MIYTLENENLKLSVNSLGAEMYALEHKPDGAPLLWNGDKAVWPRRAPVLFPYAGKIKDGKVRIEGAEYPAPQHGFARDLEHTLVAQTADSLTFELAASEETRKFFPYNFVLRTIFRLEGNTLHHTLEVDNRDERPMQFGIGYHPGFVLPFDEAHTTADYEVRFDGPQTPVVVNTQPGGLVNGDNGPLVENQDVIPLRDDMFDADSICLSKLTSRTLDLVEKDTGRGISFNIEGYPYVLLWSMPTRPLHFLCVEPWHSLPDRVDATGEWNDKTPAARLAPGESFSTDLAMTFRR